MAEISVSRNTLSYVDGGHRLELYVEWSGVAKTEDNPCDFEVHASDLSCWTEPKGEAIPVERQEAILDEIAAYYSTAPAADIIGKRGELLRGQSKYRFSLQIYPEASRYYEVGRTLEIPMAPPAKGSKERAKYWVLDVRGVTEWTKPREPIARADLERIVRKIVAKEGIGVIGL